MRHSAPSNSIFATHFTPHRKPKRAVAEDEKSLLATAIAFKTRHDKLLSLSQRDVHKSDELKCARASEGLDPEVSLGAISHHYKRMAFMIGVPSLTKQAPLKRESEISAGVADCMDALVEILQQDVNTEVGKYTFARLRLSAFAPLELESKIR